MGLILAAAITTLHTQNHENGTFWPKELLPQSIPSARILLFSYNANVFFGVPTLSSIIMPILCLTGYRENEWEM